MNMIDKPTASGRRNLTGLICASILGLVLIGIAILAADYLRRRNVKRKWVSEAQAAVDFDLSAREPQSTNSLILSR